MTKTQRVEAVIIIAFVYVLIMHVISKIGSDFETFLIPIYLILHFPSKFTAIPLEYLLQTNDPNSIYVLLFVDGLIWGAAIMWIAGKYKGKGASSRQKLS